MKKPAEGLINAVLLVLFLVVAFGCGEVLLRFYFKDRLVVYQEERALLYRYDRRLGWFPQENSSRVFVGSHPIEVTHNSRGFRDVEHKISSRPGLLVLGDSFVWGYDVEVSQRFTEKLRLRMPEWAVYNLGVSGYATDQELLLLNDQFDYYQPRIVLLVFCTYNDPQDNASNNIGQGGYYKPYFETGSQGLRLQGVPVPTSLSYFGRQHPLLANSYLVRLAVKALAPPLVSTANPTIAIMKQLNDFVAQKGSQLVVGLEQPYDELETFLRMENIPYLQLDGAERFPDNGWHWTPDGHTTVSNAIFDYLMSRNLLDFAGEKQHQDGAALRPPVQK